MSKKRAFLSGFLFCYLIAGFVMARDASEIPATTKAGVVYAGLMWMPISVLPDDLATAIVPSWCFDFERKKGND